MLKQIIVMRHAQTESFSDSGSDFARKLTAKGCADAAMMAKKIAKQKVEIDLIISSTSCRTRQTIDQLLPLWPAFKGEINYEDDSYLASAGELVSRINSIEPPVNTVMFMGHNPGLHQLVELLSGRSIEKFSPAYCAILESSQNSWDKVKPKGARLKTLLKTD